MAEEDPNPAQATWLAERWHGFKYDFVVFFLGLGLDSFQVPCWRFRLPCLFLFLFRFPHGHGACVVILPPRPGGGVPISGERQPRTPRLGSERTGPHPLVSVPRVPAGTLPRPGSRSSLGSSR